MKHLLHALAGLFASGFFWVMFGQPATAPVPLIQAHAHNDYEHQRPLFDALDQGFCSVEADIYLVDGRLLVAHDRDKVSGERTLEALYLKPLHDRVRLNGGMVYPKGPTVTLLIDIKSEAETTYAALREVLKQHQAMLTVFGPGHTKTNAVTVIVSGNRPRNMMAEETVRYAGYDGRLADLDAPESRHLIPLISDNWQIHFKWRGAGPFLEEEKQKLKQIVTKAHQQARHVRFWATADIPAVWRELQLAGVDLINTDKLDGLKEFLRQKPNPAGAEK